MKKLSKIGLLVLAFALICAGLVMSASGAEVKNGKVSYVDAAGNTKEGTLSEAWQNAATDTVITLLGNCEMEEGFVLTNKNLTVDIGGYTLTSIENSAFTLNTNTNLSIIGSGKIVLDGMLATSTAEGVSFSIVGTAGTKGIDITHSGFSNNRIVYTEFGVWNFKNIDVLSDTTGKNWHCFFEMRNVSTTDVDFTFDTVNVVHATTYVSHPGQFITNVAGTGHLSVINSTFKTEHSGIKSGVTVTPGEEAILIKNSAIIAETDSVSVKDNRTVRNYAILGMDDSFKGSPKHIVNIYDSFLSSNYRTICYENVNGVMEDNIANIYDSTIKVTALNGNDTSENVSRAIVLHSYGNTAFINRKYAVAGATGSKQPYLVAEAGFRTNLLGFTTSKKDAEGVKVIENIIETTDPTTGEVTKVEYEYKFACESAKYTWVYDPVGNADAPYLLVKKEDAVGYADASKFAGFETYQFSSTAENEYTEYMIYKDSAKIGSWNSYEPFGQSNGSGNPASGGSKNKMENFHWAQRGGTYFIAGDSNNKYMKYWVEPNASDPTATRTTLAGSDAPFWVIGEMVPSSDADMAYVRTMVQGENRKSVIVIDIDFGSENGVYPDLNLKFASRYKTSTKYDNLAQFSQNWFEIREGGTVKSNLTTTGTDLESVPTPELNGANEWNHLSVVFYTDLAYEGGLAYVYLNGELMGTQAFYTSAANENVYLQGIRFDIPQGQVANSILCIDNMSMRSYINYQVEGEADGADKSPEHYMIANAPGRYINTSLTVAGNSYRGADVETLQAKAEELGTVIRLQDDFFGTINSNTTIYTNGYEMNPTDDSYAANVVYDANSGNFIYQFNELYNDLKVVYYWYIGEYGNVAQMKDDSYYIKTEVAPGQTPTYTGAPIESVKDTVSLAQKIHCGWHSSGDDLTVETLAPVTLSMAIAQAGKPIYMYPSYYNGMPTAYVKAADGSIVSIASGALEASQLLASLKPGETFVVCEDFHIDDSYTTPIFSADKATYGGKYDYDGDGVLEQIKTSSSTETKVYTYTAEELQAMKDASAKIALDLNGHTISIGSATKRKSLIFVNSNVTLSVYSSVPGGMISSVQGESGDYGIKSLRIFGIHNGTESLQSSFNTSNAHIQIGTVEVDGEIIPGSNLTLYGCVIAEGITGDDTCSIEVDGIRAIRHNPDSGGAFMTRFYSGTFHVNNTVVLAPTSSSVIYLIYSGNTRVIMTPEMLVENTIIINNGSGIIAQGGDSKNKVCLTLKNVVTNGEIAFTENKNGGNVSVDSGVLASAINPKNVARIGYADGVSFAKYNQPMTLAGITDENMLKVTIPQELGSSSNITNVIDPEGKYVYIVDAANEKYVPKGEKNVALVLPTLAVGSALSTDVLNVTFMGLDGKPAQSENFIKGGLPTAPTVSDYKLSAFTTLVFKGTFDKPVTTVSEAVVYNPVYDVVNNVPGIKSSVSFYTSFNVNIYVPAEYKDYFKRATANGVALTLTDVVVDGIKYVMCSAPISADKFAEDTTFVLEFDETNGDVVYSGTETVTMSVMSYAEIILANVDDEYTAAEMTLVYTALNYANESIIFANGSADSEVAALVEEYSDLMLDLSDDMYADAVEETNLGAAFLKANVRLSSSPAIVFTMKRDFVGTVTFTVGGVDIEFTVSANNQRTIVLEDLTIAEFTSDILVSVNGSIGDTSIVIEDGKYNLATYAQYHVENSTYAENTIPSDSQLTSKKALAVIDAMYVYAAAAAAYVAD